MSGDGATLTLKRQTSRPVLWLRVLSVLLLVVAAAAAVLSFAALRDLALLCGFSRRLAWLLPVVVDAGAAAGSLVWLGGASVADAARRFARTLALTLLGLSVAANALGHWLEAFHRVPPWWVVVAVSATAPAVLGAVVHLAVLVGRQAPTPECSTSEPPAARPPADPQPAGEVEQLAARARQLVTTSPDRVGRRRLARELNVTEHHARQLLAQLPDTTTTHEHTCTTAHTTPDLETLNGSHHV